MRIKRGMAIRTMLDIMPKTLVATNGSVWGPKKIKAVMMALLDRVKAMGNPVRRPNNRPPTSVRTGINSVMIIPFP